MSPIFYLCRHCMPDGVEPELRTARELGGRCCTNCGRLTSDESERGRSFYAVKLQTLLDKARALSVVINRVRNGDRDFLGTLVDQLYRGGQ